jgi:hypothetical protein
LRSILASLSVLSRDSADVYEGFPITKTKRFSEACALTAALLQS